MEIFNSDLTKQLQSEAKEFSDLSKKKDSKQWYFGELANELWEENEPRLKQSGGTFEEFCNEMARVMNNALPFPDFNGKTIRFWANLEKTYQNFPQIQKFRKVLSFDHFVKAKILYGNEVVSSPAEALLEAVELKFTASEMYDHYTSDKPFVSKVTAWLNNMPAISWESPEVKKQAMYHLSEYRKLAEKSYDRR